MQKNKGQVLPNENLIGNKEYNDFLRFQTDYAIAKRGGSLLLYSDETHLKRLVNQVNLLNHTEQRALVYSSELTIQFS